MASKVVCKIAVLPKQVLASTLPAFPMCLVFSLVEPNILLYNCSQIILLSAVPRDLIRNQFQAQCLVSETRLGCLRYWGLNVARVYAKMGDQKPLLITHY